MTVEEAVTALLGGLGQSEHPEVAGTPERVAELWRDRLLSGYSQDPAEVLADRLPAPVDGVVVTLTGVPFHGVCPHHLVPYLGEVHLAYEPGEGIVGLGALERLVEVLSRRLVLQEELTRDVAEALRTHLGAKGAACAASATHLCMVLRGREPRTARVHTRYACGSLEDRPDVLPPVPA